MSVRRETMTDHSTGSGLMKSALFWMTMLTASFLLGFLVIAPLMQLTRSRGEAAPAANVGNANQKPPFATHAAAPVQKQNVEPDEPVDITPDRTTDSNISIQPGADPTENGAQQEPRRDESAETPQTVPPAGTGEERTGSATRDSSTERAAERTTRRSRSDRSEQPSASPEESTRSTTTESGEPVRRSGRRSRGTDTEERRAPRTREDGDIQRGEGIDR